MSYRWQYPLLCEPATNIYANFKYLDIKYQVLDIKYLNIQMLKQRMSYRWQYPLLCEPATNIYANFKHIHQEGKQGLIRNIRWI